MLSVPNRIYKLSQLVRRDLKTVYKSQYNLRHPFFALLRYIIYLNLKFFKLSRIKIKIWKNKRIYLYSDSVQSSWLLFNYIIDYEEFEFYKRILKSKDCVFEVGSNVGYHLIWMSKYVTDGDIIAFEPNLKNFSRLTENCLLNSGNFVLNNLAVSSSNGFVNFSIQKDTLNHIIKDLDSVSDYEMIKSVSIDNYCASNSIESIQILKIDVEGFEYEVIKGCDYMLKNRKIDIIQLEIDDEVALLNSNVTVEAILDLLLSYSYKLCMFNLETGYLELVNYSTQRDNYFAIYDIDSINLKLQQ